MNLLYKAGQTNHSNDMNTDINKMPQRGIMTRIRNNFFTGMIVTAPIAITLYLTWAFLSFVDTGVRSLIPLESLIAPENQKYILPGVGIILAVLFFTLVGLLARNVLGRFFLNMSDRFFDRVPLIRNIYSALKQIIETIMASQSQAFRDVVMLEYPRKGVWSMGFVTGTTKGEVQTLTSKETMNVFVPTTPNPTSGFLLFVPREDLHYLNMTTEEGIKMVVSGGIITPEGKLSDKEKEEIKNTA